MRVIVPRLIDAANVNAQVLNARGLLSRFSDRHCQWHCMRYGEADPAVAANPAVKVTRLARWRFWRWHLALLYQRTADAIFYPGSDLGDWVGLHCRDFTGRSIPVIATLEGLVGDAARERRVSVIAGHPVFCQPVPAEAMQRFDYVLERADHIVAISPFLGKMARRLYGEKCSVLPMGIDRAMFAPCGHPQPAGMKTVLSVGHVRPHKRPDVFLDLAGRFPGVKFRWIGEGEPRDGLNRVAAERGLRNLTFAGGLSRRQVADQLRVADVFVMPSRAEGVPKVVQEAVACGVPCVVFGYYETPSVVDGDNGYVVWSDGEMARRLGELLSNAALREQMGRRGRDMAAAWDWSVVAPQWEQRLLDIVTEAAGRKH